MQEMSECLWFQDINSLSPLSRVSSGNICPWTQRRWTKRRMIGDRVSFSHNKVIRAKRRIEESNRREREDEIFGIKTLLMWREAWKGKYFLVKKCSKFSSTYFGSLSTFLNFFSLIRYLSETLTLMYPSSTAPSFRSPSLFFLNFFSERWRHHDEKSRLKWHSWRGWGAEIGSILVVARVLGWGFLGEQTSL